MMTSTLKSSANAVPNPYRPDTGHLLKSLKPLPPYGKEAALLMSWGVQPRNCIFIFAGIDGWRKAKAFENTQVVLCLPYGKDPSAYFWPVKDCPVLLIDTGFLSILDIEKFSYCLLCANAEIVHVILSNHRLVIYRRSTI